MTRMLIGWGGLHIFIVFLRPKPFIRRKVILPPNPMSVPIPNALQCMFETFSQYYYKVPEDISEEIPLDAQRVNEIYNLISCSCKTIDDEKLSLWFVETTQKGFTRQLMDRLYFLHIETLANDRMGGFLDDDFDW